ncbi:hypothetical protein B0T14DRAFT_562775 [Immersiella caudata]|uniref:Uncharacterized protein n=1 Tax=Immersiella caudata TaxID=314043 RepID=A0AA39X412_9PEZI|nr:hypothetical protein B0T14DRAFT_562775 [Immersiella caudata]
MSVADPAEMKTTASHSSAPPEPVSASHAFPRYPVDGEPVRKRPRTTPNSAASPEPKPNGTGISSSSAPSGFGGNKYERLAPAPHINASRSSSASSSLVARPGGRQGPTFKLSSNNKTVKPPVRKMAPPPEIKSLFPRHGNETGPQQPVECLPARWDGTAITTEKPDSDRELPPSVGVYSYWELKQSGNPGFERKTLPTAQLSKISAQLSNGQSHQVPERDQATDRCNHDGRPRTLEELKATLEVEAAAQHPPEQPRRPFKTKASKAPVLVPTKPVPQNQKFVDESLFDNLVYGQNGAATPPPQVRIPASPAGSAEAIKATEPLPPDEPFYADIDPRVHWPQPHSEAWLEVKQNEIEARGRRKAKFGRAAQRIRERQRLEEPTPLDDAVPEKVLRDPAWFRVWKMLHGGGDQGVDAPVVPAGNGNGNGTEAPRRGRKPGPKKQATQVNGLANGNTNGHTNGHANGLTNGYGPAGGAGGSRG